MKYLGKLKTDIRSICRLLQNAGNRNQRRPKQMERHTVFMEWKVQH